MKQSFYFEKSFYDKNNFTLKKPIKTMNFSIYQIGEGNFPNGCNIPNHEQIFDLEFTVVIDCSLQIYTNNIESLCKKNDIYISFKNDIHKIYSKNQCRYKFLAMNINPKSECYNLLNSLHKAYNDKRIKNCYNTTKIFSEILSDILNRKKFTLLYIDAKITEILINLIRKKEKSVNAQCADDIVMKICNYIDNNFLNISSLSSLSNIFNYTHSYLDKLFLKTMDITMQQYLLQRKMEYAKETLSKTNKSVTDVSYSLNYTSPYNFTRAYKSYYGHSPIEDTSKRKIKDQLYTKQ